MKFPLSFTLQRVCREASGSLGRGWGQPKQEITYTAQSEIETSREPMMVSPEGDWVRNSGLDLDKIRSKRLRHLRVRAVPAEQNPDSCQMCTQLGVMNIWTWLTLEKHTRKLRANSSLPYSEIFQKMRM